MDYLLAWPFYFWSGLTGLYKLSLHLPWPTRAEWFRWFLFLILGKLLWYLVNRRMGTRCPRCSKRISEHGAAAVFGALSGNH